jgi:hypothetical protein
MQSTSPTDAASTEPFLTKKLAAAALNLPCYKIQRAAKLKLIPTYKLLDSREYVKLSDIRRVMGSDEGTP